MPSKLYPSRLRAKTGGTLALLVGVCLLFAACSAPQEADPVDSSPTQPLPVQPAPTATSGPEIFTLTPTPLPSPAPSATPEEKLSREQALRLLSRLPISFPIMSEEIAAYFNRIAREDDSALIPVAYLDLLSKVTAGKRRVGFASWQQAELNLSVLRDSIQIVSYNPEHWDQTPEDEKADLVKVVERAREAAHTHGLDLLVAPDRRFAQEYLGGIAPYADIIGLQGQRLQADPAEFAGWIGPMIQIARESNPDVLIYVQVGPTQGTAEEMLAALQTVAGEIDGISIWSNPSTFEALQEFIALLRPEG